VLTKYLAQNPSILRKRATRRWLSRRASSRSSPMYRGISMQRQRPQGAAVRGAQARFSTSITALILTSPRATALPERRLPGRYRAADAHYVLGITKAYTTRGLRAFDRARQRDRRVAAQTRGRIRRHTGGRGAAAVRRRRAQASIQIKRVSGLCITKLDVLDGMEEVKLAPATGWPGLQSSCCRPAPRRGALRAGLRNPSGLEGQHRGRVRIRQASGAGRAAYLERLQSVCGVPIDMISTGADRNETIVRRHPFH